ncbi:alpha-glucosidase [Fulvitalea axinellae]|uniref:Alpha-glucosidase n=1 Tax=Fulvitalea axinellae TaxID=1182444 RepID=A0AAU9CPC4_9BACT|nr:alpha-glucosidase [Fulvitalea axinellae]
MKKASLYAGYLCAVLFCFCACSSPFSTEMVSPDGNLKVLFRNDGGKPVFTCLAGKDTLFINSRLGLVTDLADFSDSVNINSVRELQASYSWQPVWGKNKIVRDEHREYRFDFEKNGKKLGLVMRLYNDGFAFRYILPEGAKEVKILSEASTFNMSDDFTCWAANGERHNLGPVPASKILSVKGKGNHKKKGIHLPLVAKANANRYFAIHEAGIFDLAPFKLVSAGEKSFGLSSAPSKATGGTPTSWRTVLVGEKPGDLVESDLVMNLNPELKLTKTSWIKPGKVLWDWRVMDYQAPDGFVYAQNTASHKRFIDFASKNNVQHLIIDANWYGPEFAKESDPTSSEGAVNIEEVMAYAKAKNVGIILYLNDVGAKRFGLERVLKQFHDWGGVGVKYGFMKGKGQDKVEHTRKVIELCAKNELMVDFHDGPVPPSGDRRAFPNVMAREYCHAQADAKRSYYPETAVTAPFVNMIAGPLDMTNGWYGLNEAHSRQKVFQVLPGTVAAETAKTAVVFSGWTVLPDAPEEYEKKADIFEFIREQPVNFDGLRVLNGEIGEYITVARPAGDAWFLGSLTNRDSRSLDISLDFLENGKKYRATLYEDTPDSHYENNKESYKIREITVDNKTVLKAKMAPGGGHAVWIRPA